MQPKIPHPIPYQGSKRNIAKFILPFFPRNIDRIVEPFAGSAAITIAAAYNNLGRTYHLNDLNKPLALLIEQIINNPAFIADEYTKMWNKQRGNEKEFFVEIRKKFNETKYPEYLLFLLARGVKGAIRYNSKGEFNQSPDNRRLGRAPDRMSAEIFSVSHLLKGNTVVSYVDYKEILQSVHNDDLIYMDPPYQGVCNNRDSRYYNGINFDEFVCELGKLVDNNMLFIVSYDGMRGDKEYGKKLPKDLNLTHIHIDAGRSTQSTLLGKDDVTIESLYISPQLIENLNKPIESIFKNVVHNSSIYKVSSF